jgi:mitochondrial fission protein ELM1
MPETENSGGRLAWMLTGDKAGDNAQMRVLAKAAGLAPIEIPLEFNGLYRLSNWRLGATTRTLTDGSRQKLQPPWPDIVLSSGRRSVPVARWIKRQSGGRTKLVHVGRPWGRAAWFDLVIAMPQYDLPERHNVFQARMPFNAHSPQALAAAADRWRERLNVYPRPWIGVLVGGKSAPFVLDAKIAGEIGKAVSKRARDRAGSVLVVTSRRTGPDATEALFGAIEDPALRYNWRKDDPDSPYLAILALSDEFVVSGDSASMLAEAVRSGRPVSIACLPIKRGRRRRRVDIARKILPRRIFDLLVDWGLITSTRHMNLLHRRLVAEGLAAFLPSPPPTPKKPFDDDLRHAANLIRAVAAKAN